MRDLNINVRTKCTEYCKSKIKAENTEYNLQLRQILWKQGLH